MYTSELERELHCALQIWKSLGKFSVKPSSADLFTVKMMYTSFWLGVLGIDGQALIYEPANHVNLCDFPEAILHWLRSHPYGEEESINHALGIAGYLPFWSSLGMTRLLSYSAVPHHGNWEQFEVPENDVFWYAVNLFCGDGRLRDQGPEGFSSDEIRRRMKMDLQVYYGK